MQILKDSNLNIFLVTIKLVTISDTFGFKQEMSMNQSLSKMHELHQNVLKEVIKKKDLERNLLQLAVSKAQKEIKRLDGFQNTMILMKNKTESQIGKIWTKFDDTVVYVEDEFKYYFEKFIVIGAVCSYLLWTF